jgi:hypothetical protein
LGLLRLRLGVGVRAGGQDDHVKYFAPIYGKQGALGVVHAAEDGGGHRKLPMNPHRRHTVGDVTGVDATTRLGQLSTRRRRRALRPMVPTCHVEALQ